jgi:hypothetical protein
MSGDRYKINDQQGMHFVTSTRPRLSESGNEDVLQNRC